MDYHERRIAEAMGEKKHKPFVSFFDHAVEDQELSKESGRPRFVERVYIQKIPSAPDLARRDIFTRAMVESDKDEFPDEWAHYLDRKGSMDNLRPPIEAIPGMSLAQAAELKALGIDNCQQLVEYAEGLDELEPLRATAQQIMRISDALRKERDDIRTEGRQRPIQQGRGFPGAERGRITPIRTQKEEGHEEKGYEEAGEQEEGQPEESFHYEFKVSV